MVLFESTIWANSYFLKVRSVLSKSTLRTRAGALRTLVRGMEIVLFESTIWANSYFWEVRPYFWKVHVESRMHDGWHAQMTIFGVLKFSYVHDLGGSKFRTVAKWALLRIHSHRPTRLKRSNPNSKSIKKRAYKKSLLAQLQKFKKELTNVRFSYMYI